MPAMRNEPEEYKGPHALDEANIGEAIAQAKRNVGVPEVKKDRIEIRRSASELQAALHKHFGVPQADSARIANGIAATYLRASDQRLAEDEAERCMYVLTYWHGADHAGPALSAAALYYAHWPKVHASVSVIQGNGASDKVKEGLRSDATSAAREVVTALKLESAHKCSHGEETGSYLFGLMADFVDKDHGRIFDESLWLAENGFGSMLSLRVHFGRALFSAFSKYRGWNGSLDELVKNLFDGYKRVKRYNNGRAIAIARRSLTSLSEELYERSTKNRQVAKQLIPRIVLESKSPLYPILHLIVSMRMLLEDPSVIEREVSSSGAYA